MPVRAVLFDAVGTLIYPHPPVSWVYQQTAGRFGLRLNEEEVAERFQAAVHFHFSWPTGPQATNSDPRTDHQRERSRWRRIVGDVFPELAHSPLFEELFETLWRHFAESKHWAIFDDVVPVWLELRSQGYPLGVASNFDDRLGEIWSGLCRRSAPLRDRGKGDIFWSSQIGWSKPHSLFFETIAARLELAPSSILLLGDDPEKDIQGAKNAGWNAIQIDRGEGICDNLASNEKIAALTDMPMLLARM